MHRAASVSAWGQEAWEGMSGKETGGTSGLRKEGGDTGKKVLSPPSSLQVEQGR